MASPDTQRLRLRPGIIAVGLGLVVLFFATVVGLALAVTEPGVAPVAPGETFEGEPWNVTVHEVLVGAQQEYLEPPEPGDRFIVVRATVEVTADETRSDVGDALRLIDVPGLREERPQTVQLRRDGSSATGLHPGLAEEVELWWAQDGSQPAPSTVEVQIIGMTFREDRISGVEAWLDPRPRASVTLDTQPAPTPELTP